MGARPSLPTGTRHVSEKRETQDQARYATTRHAGAPTVHRRLALGCVKLSTASEE